MLLDNDNNSNTTNRIRNSHINNDKSNMCKKNQLNTRY